MKRLLLSALVMACCATAACEFTLDLGTDTLFSSGSPFILSGTAQEVGTSQGPCLIWLGENGIAYHLFQTSGINNGEFDTITTPGTTSRLEIATRSDLEVACQIGTIVEVQEILEIVP